MKIRAAVLDRMGAEPPYAKSKPLRIVELELDPPGRDEILVKVAAAGLCHSDLSVINGDRPRPMPMALGHEAAGVVEELGEDVTDLAPGDHVVMVFMPSCGHCVPCAEGRPALCEPGAAANGAGTLLSGARRLHCDATVNARAEDAAEHVRALTGGGVDFAFEMAGAVRAMELAYKITRRGGSTITAGLPPPTAALPLPLVNLVAEERTVKGSYIGTCVPSRDIPRYIKLYRRGRLPVDRLMSGRMPLEQINEGFDLLHAGRVVRQLIEF